MSDSLALDVDRISKEALRTMAAGPATSGSGLDTERVVSVLNDVVATEVVAWLRYTRHAITARRIDRPEVSERFDLRAEQAMRHAEDTAGRIAALGGHANFDPEMLAQRAHTDYSVADDPAIRAMVEQNLQASGIVVDAYREIARWLGDRDPDSRRLVESVLADERDNARALTELLRLV
ncbi:ferritin-like domain-containing protein [Kitasatospora sp. NPDC094015]|uniref:ferritin-like domain-containing protein n=1 Tax=Kitasatospora sp. NPDC094015 TaxID=3155205 RepID=UPI00331C77C1